MALKDKLITLEDLKAVHDVDAGEITGIKADLGDLYTLTYQSGAYNNSNGVAKILTTGTSAPYKCTQFDCRGYSSITVNTYCANSKPILATDDLGTVLGEFPTGATNITTLATVNISIPEGATRLCINCNKEEGYNVSLDGITVKVLLDIANDNNNALSADISAIENEITNVDVTFTDGTISASGVISNTPSNVGNCKSNLIPKDRFSNITISANSGYTATYALFNNGTFVSRASWSATERTIDNTYDVILLFAATSGTVTKDTVLANVSYTVNTDTIIGRLESIENQLADTPNVDYLNQIIACDTPAKIIHFSVDDTWMCLKDITENAYSSVFENTFLGQLKTLHDTYGICVTLNTFNTYSEDATYDISNVPNTYQAEFQSAKNWLKFAFHAESDLSNYNTSTGILESYNKFVSAIYTLTGDYDCIDSFTRLGFFGGTLSNVLAIKNAEHGIKGLLTADDTRTSYYLNASQNAIVSQKGKYYDLINEMIFIRTITRTTSAMISEIQNNLCYQKYVEIFAHEYAGLNFEAVAQWSQQNGFSNAFPSLVFNVI